MVSLMLSKTDVVSLMVGDEALHSPDSMLQYDWPVFKVSDIEAYRSLVDEMMIQVSGRFQIILEGGPIETSLTQIALSALMDGFQVYLLVDHAIFGATADKASPLERLYQFGVVPVTQEQVRSETQLPLRNHRLNKPIGVKNNDLN